MSKIKPYLNQRSTDVVNFYVFNWGNRQCDIGYLCNYYENKLIF